MSGDVLGGGIVVAIAAVLWLAYLVPNWLQRREYLATERNVVRLQQTLRILAETSEVPDEVRVEANAREVAVQRKALRAAERRQRADAWLQLRAARVATENPAASLAATSRPSAANASTPRLDVQQRRRRARRLTSLVLLIGMIATGAGTALVILDGSWVLLATSGALVVASIVLLVRLAGPLPRAVPVATAPSAVDVFDHSVDAVDEVPSREWTPQPLPKPLHLSKGTAAASAMASVDAAADLRRALARARMELRAEERATFAVQRAHAKIETAPLSVAERPVATAAASGSAGSAPAPSAAASRFASMGVVDEQPAAIDLNEALRRRRAV